MKKALSYIIGTAALFLLTFTYIQADDTRYPSVNAKCKLCQHGFLEESNQGVIFEFTDQGLQPVFDAKFFKCNHCQSLTQQREFKNGYFSIPMPK